MCLKSVSNDIVSLQQTLLMEYLGTCKILTGRFQNIDYNKRNQTPRIAIEFENERDRMTTNKCLKKRVCEDKGNVRMAKREGFAREEKKYGREKW